MPHYPYECPECDFDFEITKSVKEIDDPEHCPACNSIAERYIAKTGGFIGASDWDTAHYNPAFGKVMKSNAEARKEAKRLGMEEVGNEPVEKIHKKFDCDRKDKNDKLYDDLFSTNVEVNSK